MGEYFAEHCADRGKAKYRLAAYVAYEGAEDVTPTFTLISGHFVAYFKEGDHWYEANDSNVELTEMNGAPPIAFPYICILERLDLGASMPWPAMVTARLDTGGPDDEEEDTEPKR